MCNEKLVHQILTKVINLNSIGFTCTITVGVVELLITIDIDHTTKYKGASLSSKKALSNLSNDLSDLLHGIAS